MFPTKTKDEKSPLISPQVQNLLRNFPTTVNCPLCRTLVTTQVEHVRGKYSWTLCGIVFGSGFLLVVPWLYCWVPLCLKQCKDTIHYCPNCKTRIGRYVRSL